MSCSCEALLRGRGRAPGGARNAHALPRALRLPRSGVHALTAARYAPLSRVSLP
jgi:hypothetical protein